MRHVVYGTAGHIDHGKTALIKALTGTDCDRLPEEQERGITIDLGFAQLTEQEMQLHFVDVPGHERLVHTMIAGASGIDLALLVVAADEGIKPQTLEHLEVIRLMGVPGGAVAITKTDLVDEELASLAAEEIREHLADTPFAQVPVILVSAHTGRGLAELRSALLEQAAQVGPRHDEQRPFREAVDRIFTLAGVGTVVTGTSLWGSLEVGAEVMLFPGGKRVRARRLHVHGSERQRVEAGERVALNLAGVARHELVRGQQILSPGPWQPSRLITIRLELLATAPHPLDEGDEVELHALAARVNARVERLSQRPLPPGATAVAQLGLATPLLLFPADRLVLRRPAPVNTFAGGMVLDTALRRVRRRDSAALLDTPSPHHGAWDKLLQAWIVSAGLVAPTVTELAGRLGVDDEALQAPLGKLLNDTSIQTLPTTPQRFVAEQELANLARAAATELRQRLAEQEVSAGIPSRDFIASLLPRPALELADVYLEELRHRDVIALVSGRVVPAGKQQHMTEKGKQLSRDVEQVYLEARLDPPSPAAVAEQLTAKPAMVEGICQFLVQRQRLARLQGKLYIHRAILDEVAAELRTSAIEVFSVGEFKQRFGLTRKLAIPLLEWLDSNRVTVRQGDNRKILR